MTIQGWKATLVAGTLAFGVMAVTVPAEAKAKWSCQKDGKKVKAKGKNAKAQQKDCEGKGGTWADTAAAPKEAATTEPAAEPAAPPADSGGGGGGW